MSDPERLENAKRIWETQAQWNTRIAILDTAEVRDTETGEEAFEKAGRDDARRMAAYFAPGGRVLDLGCGIGRVLRYLAPRCTEAIGVDISATMLDEARPRLARQAHVRLVETRGSDLPGVDENSLDFLFSLYVLIHVDRRSAYRYFQQFAKVLRPGGLAHLQFHDILEPASLPKFLEVLDSDYPLEFYTLEEFRYLLQTVGLETIHAFKQGTYWNLTAINGDAERWLREQSDAVRTSLVDACGCLAAPAATTERGAARLKVENRSDRDLTWMAHAALVPRDSAGAPQSWFHLEAPVCCPPGKEIMIAFDFDPALATGRVLVDGAAVPESYCEAGAAAAGPYDRNLALVPCGFEPTEQAARRFPHCFSSEAVDVVTS